MKIEVTSADMDAIELAMAEAYKNGKHELVQALYKIMQKGYVAAEQKDSIDSPNEVW